MSLLSLLSLTAQAEIINLRVDDHICGEIDPYVLINWGSNVWNYFDSSDLQNAFYYRVFKGEEGNNLIATRVDQTEENTLLTDYADVYADHTQSVPDTQPSSNNHNQTSKDSH